MTFIENIREISRKIGEKISEAISGHYIVGYQTDDFIKFGRGGYPFFGQISFLDTTGRYHSKEAFLFFKDTLLLKVN